MNIIIILLPLALMLGFAGLAAFLWSLNTGQFEDLEGAGWRVLSDDDLQPPRSPSVPARKDTAP